jgi:MYXO-CTERM domain-containing protein
MVHIMRNNIGFPNRNSNMTGVDTQFNSGDLNLTPAARDFASITDPSVTGTGLAIESSGALGPRQADGSFPNIDFLKLAAGSQMIDKGTNVGLPFAGTAPDLGAYEYGLITTTGSGGATGAGGSTGAGGAATTGAGGARTGAGGAGAGGTSTGGAGGTSGTAGAPGGTGGSGTTTVGTGGAAGASAGTAGENVSGGCACVIDDTSGHASAGFTLTILGALASLLRRRRRAGPRV